MQNSKLAKLKAERAKQFRLANQRNKDEIKDALISLYELINGKETIEIRKTVREVEVRYDWDKLLDQIKAIRPIVNIETDLSELKDEIRKLKLEVPSETKVDGLEELIDAVKQNKPIEAKIDAESIVKAIIRVEQRIQESTVETSQAPDEYQPVRRVVKVGNRLIFDDNLTQTSGGRGGGGGQTALLLGTALVGADNPLPVYITDAEINVELDQPSSSSVTSVNDSTSNQTLVASSSTRKKLVIFNESSAALYVKLGATATTTDYSVKLNQNDSLSTDYRGRVDGIWASDSNGAAKVTELT